MMARAVRAGRKKKKLRAVDVARIFTIYVNPLASIATDPEQLQKRAFSILAQWSEEGTLKDEICRAVLHYTDSYPEAGIPQSQQWARDQAAYLAEFLIPQLKNIVPPPQIVYMNGATPITEQVPLDSDEEDFAMEHLRFGTD